MIGFVVIFVIVAIGAYLKNKIFGYSSSKFTAIKADTRRENGLMMTSCEYMLGKSKFVFEFHTPGQLIDEWVANLLPAQTVVERKVQYGNPESFFEMQGQPVSYRGSSMYLNVIFVVGQEGEYNERGDTYMQPKTGLIVLSDRHIEREDIAMVQKEAIEFMSSISSTLLKALPGQLPQIQRIRAAQSRGEL